jgi:hypothetical protein
MCIISRFIHIWYITNVRSCMHAHAHVRMHARAHVRMHARAHVQDTNMLIACTRVILTYVCICFLHAYVSVYIYIYACIRMYIYTCIRTSYHDSYCIRMSTYTCTCASYHDSYIYSYRDSYIYSYISYHDAYMTLEGAKKHNVSVCFNWCTYLVEYICKHMRAHLQVNMNACTHTCNTYVNICEHTCRQIWMHTYTHTHAYMHDVEKGTFSTYIHGHVRIVSVCLCVCLWHVRIVSVFLCPSMTKQLTYICTKDTYPSSYMHTCIDTHVNAHQALWKAYHPCHPYHPYHPYLHIYARAHSSDMSIYVYIYIYI